MKNREKLDDNEKYYVYGLYDPEKRLPFYVGKGTKYRKDYHFYKSIKGDNPHKENKIAKIKKKRREPYSKIIWDNLTEAKAYDREWALIHILNVSPGLNFTNLDYTWGCSGPSIKGENHYAYGKTLSKEHKRKISEANKGKTVSKEHRQKLSEAHKGKTISEKTKEKMSEAHKKK